MALSGINNIVFSAPNLSLTLSADQVAHGFAHTVTAGTQFFWDGSALVSTNAKITVLGAPGVTPDLSGWTYSGVTAVNFVGSAGADSVTLVPLAPGQTPTTITLGGGADTITLAPIDVHVSTQLTPIVVNDFQAGAGDWVGQLSAGTSRAQVVVGFSESGEHIGNTAQHVDSGIWLA